MVRQESKPLLGIWRYATFLPFSPDKITLGEGGTSLVKKGGIYFKCEFQNPSGSVKDRSFAYQISKIKSLGWSKAVISSSGNAAISALFYCQKAGIILTVFVSPKINKRKEAVLKKYSCAIIKTKKPISESIRFAKENNAYNLRQSQDDNALYGYKTIAFELLEQEKNIDALFIPVSSGTTFVGIARGYEQFGRLPAFHFAQTEAVCPLASLYDKDFEKAKTSISDAIVARVTQREDQIKEIVKKSRGSGWVISDKEIKIAQNWLEKHGILCSYEGGLVLASFWKAKAKGYNYRYPLCVLTGRKYS